MCYVIVLHRPNLRRRGVIDAALHTIQSLHGLGWSLILFALARRQIATAKACRQIAIRLFTNCDCTALLLIGIFVLCVLHTPFCFRDPLIVSTRHPSNPAVGEGAHDEGP